MTAARLRLSMSEPGLLVSALAHAGLLAATLVAFSTTRPFDPAQEAVPVELITQSELNQITKGERKAETPEAKPETRADRFAEIEEKKPTPPTPEAKRDVPTPPPLKRAADPGEDEPDKPEPPRRVAVLPPPRPEPERPEPKPEPRPEPKAEPKAEPKVEPAPTAEAEPIPTPPRRPAPEKPEKKEAEAKPRPPTPPAPPKKVEEKPKLDQVARLLEQKKAEEKTKQASRPKSADAESAEKNRFDPANISRLLSKEKPQSTGQAAREPTRTASIGAPTANAAKMSPSLWGQLDAMLQEQFRRCWNNMSSGPDTGYIPQIRVTYNSDGSLASTPVLVNPTSNPAQRSVADSAMRAVRLCNPLRIPEKYAPYYHEWRARTLRFDPNEMT